MCQSTLMKDELLDTQALLCSWEHKFELIYYKLLESHIHFVWLCVHQVVHLVSEAIHKGPPICYAQWTMEWMIGNLAHEGVQHCQINSLLSVMPELNDTENGLPYGSIDLGDGYVLLHKCAKNLVIPCGNEAAAIAQFLGPGKVLPQIKKWAHLHLPNGQIACSTWRETLQPPEQICVSCNIKYLCDEGTHCGEVQYFTRLAVAANDGSWDFTDIAVIRNDITTMHSRQLDSWNAGECKGGMVKCNNSKAQIVKSWLPGF
ncbi:hypothetical protein V8B97DRAFT_1916057 [Scleroderma yunnanense]